MPELKNTIMILERTRTEKYMLIFETVENYLRVKSSLFLDNYDGICGKPYVSLIAHKEETKYGWPANSIGIAIHDNDDLDEGLIYYTNEETFFDILHELINWMIDHENGVTCKNNIWDAFELFPDVGCERKRW